MQTRVMHSILCICLICAVGSLIAAPQGRPKLKEMKDSYYPVLLAQDQPEVKKRVEPWYPELLKLAGVEGRCSSKHSLTNKEKLRRPRS